MVLQKCAKIEEGTKSYLTNDKYLVLKSTKSMNELNEKVFEFEYEELKDGGKVI